MKRYIEIIFDNSISMRTTIGNKPKYAHAKQLFRDSVLPFLDFKTDDVAFRLLRDGCGGSSYGYRVADQMELAQKVEGVNDYSNNTPLFLTIRDSIETCQRYSSSYDKMLIFVLTDGEDNCNDYMEESFNESELKKLGIDLDMLLVQFAVDSEIQTNNLNAFSQFIGATTIQVNGNQLADYKLVKAQFKKDLSKTSLNNSYFLPHCFDEKLNSSTFTWDEIESQGYLRYWAGMLFREGFIQWDPAVKNMLEEYEYREFKFLCAFRFKSDFPAELVKRMFLQLSAPYYYCLEEIYWDFSEAKWKFFPIIPKVEPVVNPERYKELEQNRSENQNYINSNNLMSKSKHLNQNTENYRDGHCYRVKKHIQDMLTFSLDPEDCSIKKIILKEGDIVTFREKKQRGRPSKTKF